MTQQIPESNFDLAWKGMLNDFFPLFMEFFFPQIHRLIDWQRGVISLDKELGKIAPKAKLGTRFVDKLVKVYYLDGASQWLLVHVEVQSQMDEDFPKRMFIYHVLLLLNYDEIPVSLAILGDKRPDWRPDHFKYDQQGCRQYFEFPMIKLLDYKERMQELENTSNPFAVVVMTHIKALEAGSDGPQRAQFKFMCLRHMLLRGYPRDVVRGLLYFIDFVMSLPDDLDKRVDEDLHSVMTEEQMEYMTGFERRAMEKGLEQGLEQGLERGLEQGIEKGLEQGLERGRIQTILSILQIKFGDLPQWAIDQVSQADAPQLDKWLHAIFDCQSLEELFS